MSVLGFDEARTHAESVRNLRTARTGYPGCLTGGTALKLVAWGERDDDLRVKDALDIRHLLENYSRLPHELTGAWDDLPRFEQFNGDIELVAASLLGGQRDVLPARKPWTSVAEEARRLLFIRLGSVDI